MRITAVQFRGIEQTTEAYMLNDMAPWSIWNGKDMMFVYEGDDIDEGAQLIEQVMQRLQKGNSEAAYTLRVYDDWHKGQKIKSNTPYSRSFNFAVFEAGATPGAQKTNGVIGAINERFDQMQAEILGRVLDKINNEDEKEKRPAGLMGLVEPFLNNPDIQKQIAMGIAGFVGNILGIKMPGAGAISGIEHPPANDNPLALSEDQEAKLEEALHILTAKDPLIGEHLLKVALIARDNPGKYNMLVGML